MLLWWSVLLWRGEARPRNQSSSPSPGTQPTVDNRHPSEPFVLKLSNHATYSYDYEEVSLKQGKLGHYVSDHIHQLAAYHHQKYKPSHWWWSDDNLKEIRPVDGPVEAEVDVAMNLENHKNSEYLAEVGIGNPPQKFRVVFDTGSTNFWIDSIMCTDENCRANGRYDPALSKNAVSLGGHKHIEFGTASLDGVMQQDDVFVGPFRIRNQRFGAVTHAKGHVWQEIPMEGILGLGYPSLSAMGPSPFFDSIINQHILHSNQFAFYVSQNPHLESAVMFGGADRQYYKGDLVCFPVTLKKFWLVNINSFTLEYENNPKQAPIKVDAPPYAIFDTGSNLYTVDPEFLPGILNYMPKFKVHSDEELQDKLDSLPTMVWRMPTTDGEEFVIRVPAREYYALHAHGKAYPGWMAIKCDEPDGPAFMFGQMFMHYWYTLFDRDRDEVCVARANHDYNARLNADRLIQRSAIGSEEGTSSSQDAAAPKKSVSDLIEMDEN